MSRNVIKGGDMMLFIKNGSTTKTSSSEDTLMFSPSGFAICISEHIRK